MFAAKQKRSMVVRYRWTVEISGRRLTSGWQRPTGESHNRGWKRASAAVNVGEVFALQEKIFGGSTSLSPDRFFER